MIERRLVDEPLIETEQGSVIAPLRIDGLAPVLRAIGREWQRKQEFHITALSRRGLDAATNDREDVWEAATRLAVGRSLGPVLATEELRIVRDGDGLETVIVLVKCDAMKGLYGDIRRATGVWLELPPAHVTLYSTDPADGIGLSTQAELDELAPSLRQSTQSELRAAMGFGRAFGAT